MTISGTWENMYGSLMTLQHYDDGLIGGLYQSSTGSTGIYRVIGYTQTRPANDTSTDQSHQKKGQPIALSISWRSIDSGRSDQSWNWVSGLCGQLSYKDHNPQHNIITLSHSLVATNPFPDFAPTGTYIDKIPYNRAAPSELHYSLPSPLDLRTTSACSDASPIDGTWVGLEDPSIILTTTVVNNDQGLIRGSIILSNRIIPLVGFTDAQAVRTALTLQSLSLSGAIEETGCAISLSGHLDYAANTLTLICLTSSPQTLATLYLQTQIRGLTLIRQAV